MAAHCVKSLFLHLTPYPDERVRVTTCRCAVVWLLVLGVVLAVPNAVLLCVVALLLVDAAALSLPSKYLS